MIQPLLYVTTPQVNTMIQRMRKEGAAHEKPLTPRIENLVLIDRRVDLITPLSTQLTYEGLIDELFGIKNNTATFPGVYCVLGVLCSCKLSLKTTSYLIC